MCRKGWTANEKGVKEIGGQAGTRLTTTKRTMERNCNLPTRLELNLPMIIAAGTTRAGSITCYNIE